MSLGIVKSGKKDFQKSEFSSDTYGRFCQLIVNTSKKMYFCEISCGMSVLKVIEI